MSSTDSPAAPQGEIEVRPEMAKAGGDLLYALVRDMNIFGEPPFGTLEAREIASRVFREMLAAAGQTLRRAP